MKIMTISKAARQAGVGVETIRFYERKGLITQPAKPPGGGYRDYVPADLSTLRFIKRARDLGFSISDISSLLNLWRDQDRTSAQVKRLTEEHVARVEQRIAELQTIRKTLVDLAQGCHGDDRPECPILEDIAGAMTGGAEPEDGPLDNSVK